MESLLGLTEPAVGTPISVNDGVITSITTPFGTLASNVKVVPDTENVDLF